MTLPRPRYYVLDEDGEPTPCEDFLVFAKWRGDNDEQRIVAKTHLSGPLGDAVVSTVFLGIDHQHFDGPPMLYETMVFEGSPPPLGLRRDLFDIQQRYTTRAAALLGHGMVVFDVRRRLSTNEQEDP